MNQNTRHVILAVTAETAFRYLADIENLPHWAVHFCKELRGKTGRYRRAQTPHGEVLVRIEVDPRTGVIDFVSGPDEAHVATFPSRVVALPDGTSMYLFTSLQYPGITDAEFAGMCASLEDEFAILKRALEVRATRP